MTRGELFKIWTKVDLELLDGFFLNGSVEIDFEKMIENTLVKVFNLGVQSAMDNIELIGESFNKNKLEELKIK